MNYGFILLTFALFNMYNKAVFGTDEIPKT